MVRTLVEMLPVLERAIAPPEVTLDVLRLPPELDSVTAPLEVTFDRLTLPPLLLKVALPLEDTVPNVNEPALVAAFSAPAPAATVRLFADMLCADSDTAPPAVLTGVAANVVMLRPALNDTAPPLVVMPAPNWRSRPACALRPWPAPVRVMALLIRMSRDANIVTLPTIDASVVGETVAAFAGKSMASSIMN